ncbi:MAG: hypothetical protein JWN44_5115 [Myxococcales bacterium]|nr:hypothetical protein [Myxococcales bacterium]
MALTVDDLRWSFLDDVTAQVAMALDPDGYPATRELKKVAARMLREQGSDRQKVFWICVKYYNVRKRRIHPLKRRVIRSPELRAMNLSDDQLAALDRIEADSRAGADLTAYLSRRIRQLSYNDALLNDWGIHHLHLGAPAQPFVERSHEVLFARVHGDALYFITIMKHGPGYDPWVEHELIEILHRNWPESIEPSRVRFAQPAGPPPTADTRKKMRAAGITIATTTKDGTLYITPGGGYVSSGDSQDAVRLANMLLARVTQIGQECVDNESAIDAQIRRAGGDPALKHLRIGFLPRGGVEVFDEVSCEIIVSEPWK